MTLPLAYADPNDTSPVNLVLVLLCLGILAAVAIAALVPIGLSRSRRHGAAEVILVATLFWAVITAGLGISTLSKQMQWSHERMLRLYSGYAGANVDADAPAFPIIPCIALAAGYAGLIGWSLAGRQSATQRADPQPPPQ